MVARDGSIQGRGGLERRDSGWCLKTAFRQHDVKTVLQESEGKTVMGDQYFDLHFDLRAD